MLFSLEDDAPAYDEVTKRREWILAQTPAEQPRAYLDAFREFAALDEIDLTPQADDSGAVSSLFPEDPTEVVLADVGEHRCEAGGGRRGIGMGDRRSATSAQRPCTSVARRDGDDPGAVVRSAFRCGNVAQTTNVKSTLWRHATDLTTAPVIIDNTGAGRV